MPATPTRLAPGHPLSFLSPVSPGFPSHLSPTLQVTNTNTDEKYQKRNDNTKCCSTWLSPPSRLFLLSRFHRWTIGQDRTRWGWSRMITMTIIMIIMMTIMINMITIITKKWHTHYSVPLMYTSWFYGGKVVWRLNCHCKSISGQFHDVYLYLRICIHASRLFACCPHGNWLI